MVEHRDLVDEAEDDLHVVLDEQDGPSAAVQAADDLDESGDIAGADAGHRLVEEDDAGVGREEHGDLELALVAVGQHPGLGARVVREVHLAQVLMGRSGRLVGGPGETERRGRRAEPGLGGLADVLQGGESREDAGGLEGATEADPRTPVDGHPRDVLPCEQHAAARRGVDARDDVEQRRLAGPVGADDAEHLVLCDGEAHIPEDGRATDLQADALQGERGSVGHVCSPSAWCSVSRRPEERRPPRPRWR